MNKLIWIISAVVTAAVAVMYFMPKPNINLGFDIHILPFINAILNATVAVLLLVGLLFIKNQKQKLHKRTMITAFATSGLFLVCYIVYHTFAPETKFGGTGIIRPIYFFILITHIILAAGILPFILISLNHGLQKRFDKHKRIAKPTWYLWLYVAITGVWLYFMIAPYYV